MKNLCSFALCAGMLLCSFITSAQTAIPINQPDQNRPKLFQSYPDYIPVRMESLTSLLDLQVGREVTISLADLTSPFTFQGSVISTASKYDDAIKSVVVRSTNFPGAALTFSRIKGEADEITYSGRIISMQHADLYELKKVGNEYAMVKNKFYSVVNQ